MMQFTISRATLTSRIAGIFALVLLGVLAAAPWWASSSFLHLAGEFAVYLALATLWNLLAGYTGNLSLEIFNDVFRETPNRRTALDAMRSLLFLESECKNRLTARTQAALSEARAPAATRALQRLDLAAPPAVQPVGGFSFIEFGVDEPTGQALASTFTALGFEHTGRHRSKAVDLYCQGDIQFVINTQPGSEARQRFDELGPSVCAMGLVAPDPVQAANRAAALLSARHVSPLGPNELSCRLAKLALPMTRLSIMRPATLAVVLATPSPFRASASLSPWAWCRLAAWCSGLKSLGKATPLPSACAWRMALSFSRRSAISWFSSCAGAA